MSTETAIRLAFLGEGMCSGWALAWAFQWFIGYRETAKRAKERKALEDAADGGPWEIIDTRDGEPYDGATVIAVHRLRDEADEHRDRLARRLSRNPRYELIVRETDEVA